VSLYSRRNGARPLWWSRSGRPTPYLSSAVDQARRRGWDLRSKLNSGGVYAEPIPVVVLWGRYAPKVPTHLDGVLVIPGLRVGEAFSDVPDKLDETTVRRITDALRGYEASAEDQREPVDLFIERGLSGIFAGLAQGVGGGLTSIFLVVVLGSRFGAAVYLGVASAALGVLAYRVRALREFSVGWIAGSIGILVLLGIATVL
jgi:hypothetical protein